MPMPNTLPLFEPAASPSSATALLERNSQQLVPPAVLDALRRAILIPVAGSDEQFMLDFPQFGPALYASLKPILTALGFRWIARIKTHVGDRSAALRLERAIEAGTYHDTKQSLEFFATSPSTARVLAQVLSDKLYQDEPRILEPSAGEGVLIAAVLDAIPNARITAVELDPLRAEVLRRRFASNTHFRVVESDILAFHEDAWDGIICNLPFNAALEHAQHLVTLLRPFAPFVGIASTQRKRDKPLAIWLHERDAIVDDLPDDAFQDTTFPGIQFVFRRGDSYFDRLCLALGDHPTLGIPHIRRLCEYSRDLHNLFTDCCNGKIEGAPYEHAVDNFLKRATALVAAERISIQPAWDPRAGHGFRLVLPTGHTNDWGNTGIIVPPAQAA